MIAVKWLRIEYSRISRYDLFVSIHLSSVISGFKFCNHSIVKLYFIVRVLSCWATILGGDTCNVLFSISLSVMGFRF